MIRHCDLSFLYTPFEFELEPTAEVILAFYDYWYMHWSLTGSELDMKDMKALVNSADEGQPITVRYENGVVTIGVQVNGLIKEASLPLAIYPDFGKPIKVLRRDNKQTIFLVKLLSVQKPPKNRLYRATVNPVIKKVKHLIKVTRKRVSTDNSGGRRQAVISKDNARLFVTYLSDIIDGSRWLPTGREPLRSDDALFSRLLYIWYKQRQKNV